MVRAVEDDGGIAHAIDAGIIAAAVDGHILQRYRGAGGDGNLVVAGQRAIERFAVSRRVVR